MHHIPQRIVTILGLLFLLSASSGRALPLLDGEVGGFAWNVEAEASAVIDIPGLGLGGPDVVSDLGFDSRETALGLEGRIGDFFQLSLSLMDIDITAQKRLGPLTLATDFQATFIRPMLGIDLDLFDQVGIGIQAGIQYIDQESSLIVSPLGGFTTDDPALLPVIGGHLFAEGGNLRAQIKLVFSSLDFEDVVATFYDVEASLYFYPNDSLYLGGGYRQLFLKYDEDLLDLEVELSGPMLKAGVRW